MWLCHIELTNQISRFIIWYPKFTWHVTQTSCPIRNFMNWQAITCNEKKKKLIFERHDSAWQVVLIVVASSVHACHMFDTEKCWHYQRKKNRKKITLKKLKKEKKCIFFLLDKRFMWYVMLESLIRITVCMRIIMIAESNMKYT